MDGWPKGMGGGMVVMEVLTEGCLIGETTTYGWFGGSVEQEQGWRIVNSGVELGGYRVLSAGTAWKGCKGSDLVDSGDFG